jgi:hypothetical protein
MCFSSLFDFNFKGVVLRWTIEKKNHGDLTVRWIFFLLCMYRGLCTYETHLHVVPALARIRKGLLFSARRGVFAAHAWLVECQQRLVLVQVVRGVIAAVHRMHGAAHRRALVVLRWHDPTPA